MEVETKFHELQQSWPRDALIWTLDFVHHLPDLPQALSRWILQVPIWQNEPVLRTHIFLDGSSFASNRQVAEIAPASWAFIVVLECEVNDNDFKYRFLCAKSHPLDFKRGPLISNHVGELLSDSLTTEAVAMIWALAWDIQSPFSCHTCFHYDNMTIGHLTEGTAQWKCPEDYQVLKRNLLTLRHFLHSLGRQFSFSHMKAHVGNPWSEAVDTFAKSVAKGILTPPAKVPQVSNALRSPASTHACWPQPSATTASLESHVQSWRTFWKPAQTRCHLATAKLTPFMKQFNCGLDLLMPMFFHWMEGSNHNSRKDYFKLGGLPPYKLSFADRIAPLLACKNAERSALLHAIVPHI